MCFKITNCHLFHKYKIRLTCQVVKFKNVEKTKPKKRPIGLYNNMGPFWEDELFEITPEWLFDNMDDLM